MSTNTWKIKNQPAITWQNTNRMAFYVHLLKKKIKKNYLLRKSSLKKVYFHSDDISCMTATCIIASLSLNHGCKFVFREKETQELKSILLKHSSLLIMVGKEIQSKYDHSLLVDSVRKMEFKF